MNLFFRQQFVNHFYNETASAWLHRAKEQECWANEVAPYHFDESMSEILKLVSYCRGCFYAARGMRSMIGS